MKLALEISITADGVQDYEDLATEMHKLMRHFDKCWRDGATLSVGDDGNVFDRNNNRAGKWKIVA